MGHRVGDSGWVQTGDRKMPTLRGFRRDRDRQGLSSRPRPRPHTCSNSMSSSTAPRPLFWPLRCSLRWILAISLRDEEVTVTCREGAGRSWGSWGRAGAVLRWRGRGGGRGQMGTGAVFTESGLPACMRRPPCPSSPHPGPVHRHAGLLLVLRLISRHLLLQLRQGDEEAGLEGAPVNVNMFTHVAQRQGEANWSWSIKLSNTE